MGRVTSRDPQQTTAGDLFNAATLNGAAMLRCDDLGRISVGAKADLLFWRTDSMTMTPLRDPIKNLVYSATAEDLADVLVDGQYVQRDGVVQTVDVERVSADLQVAAERMWRGIGPGVWVERTADEWAPPTFGAWVE